MKNANYDKIQFTGIESVKSMAGTKGLKLTLNDFYKQHLNQIREWAKRGLKISKENKFQQFAIQPQPSGIRESKESIKEYSQVCFIDIDSKPENVANTRLEGVTDKIFEKASIIMQDSPFIFLQKSISGGIHVIAFITEKPASEEEFKAASTLLTAYFVYRVQHATGYDLTAVKGIVDTHNINPAQLFLISPTEMVVNTDFEALDCDENRLRECYPILFEKPQNKAGKTGNSEVKYDYEAREIDTTKRYMVSISKTANFEHLGNDWRYYLGTSLRTLIDNKSISLDYARKIFAYVVRKTPILQSSYEEQEREFESILKRKNIKPIIHFGKLKEIGIKINEIR